LDVQEEEEILIYGLTITPYSEFDTLKEFPEIKLDFSKQKKYLKRYIK